MMRGIERAVTGFTMPGIGILNFEQHAREIAKAGIYDLRIHHDQILEPVVLRHWKIAELSGLDADGERARERTIAHIEKVQRVSVRMARSAEPASV